MFDGECWRLVRRCCCLLSCGLSDLGHPALTLRRYNIGKSGRRACPRSDAKALKVPVRPVRRSNIDSPEGGLAPAMTTQAIPARSSTLRFSSKWSERGRARLPDCQCCCGASVTPGSRTAHLAFWARVVIAGASPPSGLSMLLHCQRDARVANHALCVSGLGGHSGGEPAFRTVNVVTVHGKDEISNQFTSREITNASSAGSTGFGTCMLYPAWSAWKRSSVLANAVSATAGMRR